jgi:hypothetical protein
MLADKNITAAQALETSRQEATAALQQGQQTFTAAQSELDRTQQTTLLGAQQKFATAESALDRATQISLADKSIEATSNLEKARQDFTAAQTTLDRAQQIALQQGQQLFTAGQNDIQNTFTARQAELQRQGNSDLQAKEIASREAMATLEQSGITNRFDKELALKSSQFTIEQNNLDMRQIQDNAAQLDRLGLQIKADQQKIPTAFAAQISNTAMNGVNAIMADGVLTADAKKTAITNLISYANSQITWANKFYSATIPPLTP